MEVWQQDQDDPQNGHGTMYESWIESWIDSLLAVELLTALYICNEGGK